MNRYGCHNAERMRGYFARQLHPGSEFEIPEDGWVFIKDTSTTECQYKLTTPDPKCEGCTK